MKLSHSETDKAHIISPPERVYLSARKVLYAALFAVILPVLLMLWAHQLDKSLRTPTPHSPLLGLIGAGLGIAIVCAGIIALWRYGRGLPMSPFPPLHHVSRGIYGVFAHPIYLGFCMVCGGFAIAAGSAGGFWIVTPAVILGCVAFVYGYEKPDLDRRFGVDRLRPAFSIPRLGEAVPTVAERLSVYLLVLLPWLVAYEAVVFVGPSGNSIHGAFPFEYRWTVLQWTELIYASTYLWVLATPLVARTQQQLREFAVSGLMATLVGILLFFLLPIVHDFRPFEPENFAGSLLLFEQHHDSSATAFPAFHLIWSLLAMGLWSQAYPRLRLLWAAWAAAIAMSCITTGMHALVDLAGAILVTIAVWQRHAIWQAVRTATERLANSWKEWHVGPVRIINHSLYAALSGGIGLTVVAVLVPSTSIASVFLIVLSGIVGGALFAQWVEGSSRLLRPFGYFGSVLGCCVGVGLAALQPGVDATLLFAACATAAPFTQAAGRLRCLVQGCCHGRIATSELQGIRCWHPSSRVVHLAELANHSIYPTPLYSILWNIGVGLVLARLWSLGTPATLIAGLYFILVGFGRFVEEAYRGEPQTPVVAGLRLYQWWSIAFVVVGGIVTTLPSKPTPVVLGWNWALLAPIIVGGVLWGAAMGVDFPKSMRRFARLSG